MGSYNLAKIQLGRETTAGTETTATTVWRGEGGFLKDDMDLQFVNELVGILPGTDRSYIGKYAGSLAMAATPATFEQFPYLLDAGVKTVAGVQDGTGSDYIYTYALPTTAANTIKTYTIETGDNQQEEQALYGFVSDFTLSGAAGEALMMSANWMTRQVAPGTFTAAVAIPTVETILASKGALYLDAAGGTAGSTAIAGTLLDFTLNVTSGFLPKWTVDNNSLDYQIVYSARPEMTLDITFEHDANAVAEKANWRAQTAQLLRLTFTGDAVTTAGTTYSNSTLIIDLAGKWESFDELADTDGNSTVSGTFRAAYNETAATAGQFIVVNELTALT